MHPFSAPPLSEAEKITLRFARIRILNGEQLMGQEAEEIQALMVREWLYRQRKDPAKYLRRTAC